MRVSYITAVGTKSVYILPSSAASEEEAIEVKPGTTIAFHHTSNFVVSGEAKIVTDPGTVIYTVN